MRAEQQITVQAPTAPQGFNTKTLSVDQTGHSSRGLEAGRDVRMNPGLLLGWDRDLETQATTTSTEIKGEQGGDKALLETKSCQNVRVRVGFFSLCFGQAELGCGQDKKCKDGCVCLGELCKHNPCTQTVKHIQDLEFLLWHLFMSFNETTGNEVVSFFPFGLNF